MCLGERRSLRTSLSIIMPVVKVNGKLQPKSSTINNDPDPSGMKIWGILPGKEPWPTDCEGTRDGLLKKHKDCLP